MASSHLLRGPARGLEASQCVADKACQCFRTAIVEVLAAPRDPRPDPGMRLTHPAQVVELVVSSCELERSTPQGRGAVSWLGPSGVMRQGNPDYPVNTVWSQ